MILETLFGRTLIALGFYCALGVLFAVPFMLVGLKRIDPVARQGTWGFKLLILPGVIWLWPKLLRRWIASDGEPEEEESAHRRLAKRRSIAGMQVYQEHMQMEHSTRVEEQQDE